MYRYISIYFCTLLQWIMIDCHDNHANVPIVQDEAVLEALIFSSSKNHHVVLASTCMYTIPYNSQHK